MLNAKEFVEEPINLRYSPPLNQEFISIIILL